MSESLFILILEDNPADAELVQFELQDAGLIFTAKLVTTQEDYVRELQESSPDLILSDYDLPRYNGILALAEAKKICPDTPFILVTGAVSEDRAIEILTQGAKDYVLKTRLQQRLAPAVRRALSESTEQKARKKAEAQLREMHASLERQVAERTAELQKEIEHSRTVEDALLKYNERLEILSYTAGQLLLSDKPQQLVEELCQKVMTFLDCQAFFNFLVDESAGRLRLNACAGIPPETAREIEWLDFGTAVCGCVARDGLRIIAENIPDTPDIRTDLIKSFGIKAYACHPLMDQQRVIGTLSFGTRTRTEFSTDDLAMMKAVTDQVAIAMSRVRMEDTLRESEFRERSRAAEIQAVMDVVPVAIWIAHDTQCLRITGNRYADEIMRVSHDANVSVSARPGDAAVTYKVLHNGLEMKPEELPAQIAASTGRPVEAEMLDLVFSDGRIVRLIEGAVPLFDAEGHVRGSVAAGADVTRLRTLEEKLRETTERFEMAQHAAQVGTWDWNILTGRLEWSTEMFKIFRLDPKKNKASFEVWKSILHPEDVKIAGHRIDEALKKKVMLNSDYRIISPDGQIRWINAMGEGKYNDQNQAVGMIGICIDITERKQTEEALCESEERYRELVYSSPEAVIVHRDGQFLYANPAALRLYGAQSLGQLRQKTVLDLIPEDERSAIVVRMEQGKAGERLSLKETKLTRLDGRVIEVESVGGAISYNGKPAVQVMIRDITERKSREKEREKNNRTLRALSKSNQAMMRAVDEYEYMEEVCKIIVEDCGHSMVWIGYAEKDEGKTVRPVAHHGFEEGYVDTLKITWADTERGRGPTGTAIRTGKPATCRNMLIDPHFKPWREAAIKRGYASSIVLPLMTGGKAFGALNIYSKEPDPFTRDEENLLAELANDLSYGITAIRWREALRKSEERFHAVATHTPDHILMQDRDLRYQLVINPQLGFAATDMLGKTDDDLLESGDAKKITAIKRKVMETGETVSLESSILNVRGEPEYFAGAYVPRIGPAGQIDGIIGYFRNITERRRNEEAILRAKEDWERTFDTVPDMIAILDGQHRIVRVNKAMANRLNVISEKCIGLPCHKAIHGLPDPPSFCPHSLTCRDGQQHVAEFHEACLGGDFLVSTTPLCDSAGKLIGSVHVARDITERKRVEDQLAKQAAELQERTAQLEELNRELESFSYSVSHDLRAPLRAIDGFSRKLVREYGDKIDEKGLSTINVIRSNAGLMGILIDNLLSFSRVQKTGMHIAAIDMDRLVKEVWKGIRESNKERKLSFKITKILPACGDLALIRQVLFNLFENAVKFTRNKKQGVIEMSSYIEADKIVYCIKDNGAGFDMEYSSKLFGVFQRLHSVEEYEGTGVGLAIVQRIVQRHGGKVWAEGKVGRGATFYFTLPQ